MKLSKNQKNVIDEINSRIKAVVNQPGFLKIGKPGFHLGNDTGIMILPGIDDTSYIMNDYADIFIKEGYTVYNITLPGRGLKPEEFAKTTWKDWVAFAMEDYLLLKQIVKKIFIAGFSTGATIGLYLDVNLQSNNKPDGLIMMSPAIFFVNRFLPLIVQKTLFKIYAGFKPFPKKLNNRHKIFIDPEPRKKYDLMPVGCSRAILELYSLSIAVKNDIKKIVSPILIIQSVNDIVVLPYSAKWLYKKCLSDYKRLCILKKSGHPVMVDLEKDKVFTESLGFVKDII